MIFCPIPNCPFQVPGPLRLCRSHYSLVPRPQQDALAHYARTRKGGPSHVGAFERAVESVLTLIAVNRAKSEQPEPVRDVSLPYRDD